MTVRAFSRRVSSSIWLSLGSVERRAKPDATGIDAGRACRKPRGRRSGGYHDDPATGALVFWGIICRMPRPWLALLAVVLAAAGCTGQSTASSSASASTDKPAAAPPPRPVKVFQAVEERVPRTVTSTGALAADDTVVLGVKVP